MMKFENHWNVWGVGGVDHHVDTQTGMQKNRADTHVPRVALIQWDGRAEFDIQTDLPMPQQ